MPCRGGGAPCRHGYQRRKRVSPGRRRYVTARGVGRVRRLLAGGDRRLAGRHWLLAGGDQLLAGGDRLLAGSDRLLAGGEGRLARRHRLLATRNWLAGSGGCDGGVAFGQRRFGPRRRASPSGHRGLVRHDRLVLRHGGFLHQPRARVVAAHRERRQRGDQDPKTLEVAEKLDCLTGMAAHRRADRIARVMPEQADGRANCKPGAGGQSHPAAEQAAGAVRASQQQQPADHRDGAWHDAEPQPLGRVVPGLIAAERVVEVGTDEGDQRAPDAEQDHQEAAQRSSRSRKPPCLGVTDGRCAGDGSHASQLPTGRGGEPTAVRSDT